MTGKRKDVGDNGKKHAVASLIVAFRRQNEIISLWKKASSQLEKRLPWEVLHYTLPFSYWLRLAACKRQTNAILNKIMDLFHNEIISFCLRRATIKLASGYARHIKNIWKLADIKEAALGPVPGMHLIRITNQQSSRGIRLQERKKGRDREWTGLKRYKRYKGFERKRKNGRYDRQKDLLRRNKEAEEEELWENDRGD
jgi:hypothetical protein